MACLSIPSRDKCDSRHPRRGLRHPENAQALPQRLSYFLGTSTKNKRIAVGWAPPTTIGAAIVRHVLSSPVMGQGGRCPPACGSKPSGPRIMNCCLETRMVGGAHPTCLRVTDLRVMDIGQRPLAGHRAADMKISLGKGNFDAGLGQGLEDGKIEIAANLPAGRAADIDPDQ